MNNAWLWEPAWLIAISIVLTVLKEATIATYDGVVVSSI